MSSTMIILVLVTVVGCVCVVSSALAFFFRDSIAGMFKTGGEDPPAPDTPLGQAQDKFGGNAVAPAANGQCPGTPAGGAPSCPDGFVLGTSKKKCCSYGAGDKSDASPLCTTALSKITVPTFFWGKNFRPHKTKPLGVGVGEYPYTERDQFKPHGGSNKPGGLRVPKGYVVQLHAKENYKDLCYQFGEGEHDLATYPTVDGHFEYWGSDSMKIFCGTPRAKGACV